MKCLFPYGFPTLPCLPISTCHTHSACELQKVPRNSILAVVALEQCGLSIFPWRLNRLKMRIWYFFQHVSFVKMVNRLKFCLSKIPWRSLNHLSQKSQLDLSSECQVLSTKSWWDACAEKTFRCAPVGISQTNDSVIVEHFAKLRISSNPATFTTKLNYWQHSPQSITRLVSATGQEPTVCFGQRPCNGPKKLVMYTLRFEMPTNSLNPKRFMFTRKRTHQTLMVFYKIYQKTNPDHIRISMSNFLDSEQLSSPGPSLFASLFLIA